MPIAIQSEADRRRVIDDAGEKCSMLYRAPELFDCAVGTNITDAVDQWVS